MKVKDILNLYDCLGSVAIIDHASLLNGSKLNILWCGTYDIFHPKKLEYKEIRKYLVENNIKEVWVAWGDDKGNETLKKGKEEINNMLNSENIKEYYYGTLTKSENPRHPLQRNEKWDFPKKNYL